MEPATLDDLLKVVDGNRTRIRNLASMILSSCGMLLSSTFVIIFFILKERTTVRNSTTVTLFGAAFCLLLGKALEKLLSRIRRAQGFGLFGGWLQRQPFCPDPRNRES